MTRLAFRERWQVVHEELRHLILTGHYGPSERIVETELAERFGVSRGPIREAIRLLEVEGLLERRNRQGTFVAPIHAKDVEEIYSLRRAIEALAVERAIERLDEPFVLRLRSELEAMQKALSTQDFPAFTEHDLAFHHAFYDQAGHSRLLRVWLTLQDPLRVLVTFTNRKSDEYRASFAEHVAIVEAVEAGDVGAVLGAVAGHLDHAGRLLLAGRE